MAITACFFFNVHLACIYIYIPIATDLQCSKCIHCIFLSTMLQQLMAEQQEEFISNTLLKKIQELKNEKEQLARNYEQEEEFLTNDLSRKLFQVIIIII